MSDPRRHASFTAYDRGATASPADFAPIRAELRHASRDPQQAGEEQQKRRYRLRWVLLVAVMLVVVGAAGTGNRYYGIVADFAAERMVQLAQLELAGVKLAEIGSVMKLPEFQRPKINRPINTVRVESPLHQVTEGEVRSLLARYTESGFLGVDVQDLRDELERNPWVASASVRRVWPDVLAIRITEETPIALWGDGALLNEARESFVAPLREPLNHLPRLAGPEGTEDMVFSQYQEFAAQLQRAGAELVSLSVNERGSWHLTLRDGPDLLLGRDQVEARLERFVTMYASDLRAQLAQADAVDLRYRNGFSIRAAESGADSVASR